MARLIVPSNMRAPADESSQVAASEPPGATEAPSGPSSSPLAGLVDRVAWIVFSEAHREAINQTPGLSVYLADVRHLDSQARNLAKRDVVFVIEQRTTAGVEATILAFARARDINSENRFDVLPAKCPVDANMGAALQQQLETHDAGKSWRLFCKILAFSNRGAVSLSMPGIFLIKHYRQNDRGVVQSGQIYEAYRKWSDFRGERPVDPRAFFRELNKMFVVSRKRGGERGQRYYCYHGIEPIHPANQPQSHPSN